MESASLPLGTTMMLSCAVRTRVERMPTCSSNNQENRQDWVNNTYVYGGGYVVGAPVAATAVVAGTAAAAGAATTTTTTTAAPVQAVGVLPCAAPPVNVGKVSYFRCGSTWYTPAYISGNLAYFVTAAPPGY